ncbi:hypothetical protein EXIGLDRAFT_827858 [Exidia glandulosa HHB12029]|uniref:Uncharacterized protein n=1 Tax=Exidia glandulosa HHB12029 TaxID=1314781 RepID=A0A165QPY3_EXIGL|nr:hypothetical protein EXIGLDRAFT_827858 [Exidia glandulosa HHB12029]
MPSAALSKTESQQSKKIKQPAGSKPILNWLQKKIAGTVRASRKTPSTSRRVVSLGELRNARNISIDVGSAPGSPTAVSRHSSSLAPGSIWSPTNPVEADDDASTRPLPPTSPPSPAPSRSSSSYLSDPRTFRSIAASTKPTTVLSIDVGGNTMAHIAQAPATPTTRVARPTHSPNASLSVAFSPLAVSPSSSRPPSLAPHPQPTQAVQAPVHTAHHPRNNPRPSSPPPDNASMLTLASSAYAQTGRVPPWQAGEADSVSHVFAGDESVSQFVEDTQPYEDVDASVRALRPRSERRPSWESTRSDWSGPILNGSITGSTMAIGKPRSERTAPSWKTGPLTDDWTHETAEDDCSDVDVVIKSPEDILEESPIPLNTPKLEEPSTPVDATPKPDLATIAKLPHDTTPASTPKMHSDEQSPKTPPMVPLDARSHVDRTPKKQGPGFGDDA